MTTVKFSATIKVVSRKRFEHIEAKIRALKKFNEDKHIAGFPWHLSNAVRQKRYGFSKYAATCAIPLLKGQDSQTGKLRHNLYHLVPGFNR